MRNRKNLRPQLESLESMALLSGMASAVHLHGHVGVSTENNPPVEITPAPLSGTIEGTYIGHQRNAQSNAYYNFYGAGRVTPIGLAAINGSVQLTSVVSTNSGTSALASLNGSDTLYLHGRRGSLALQVTPATTVSTSAATSTGPLTFTYTVTAANGAYQGEQGETGDISVSLHSYIPSFVHLSNFDVGRFTMTFSAAVAT